MDGTDSRSLDRGRGGILRKKAGVNVPVRPGTDSILESAICHPLATGDGKRKPQYISFRQGSCMVREERLALDDGGSRGYDSDFEHLSEGPKKPGRKKKPDKRGSSGCFESKTSAEKQVRHHVTLNLSRSDFLVLHRHAPKGQMCKTILNWIEPHLAKLRLGKSTGAG